MKNKNVSAQYVYSYTSQRDGSAPITNNGFGTYTRELVTSSTNTSQNTGDHKTGTAFTYSVTRVLPIAGTYTYYDSAEKLRVDGKGQFGFQNGGSYLAASIESSCRSQAITELLDKIRGSIDLSVDAFQMNQTISMLKSPVRRMATLVKAWKHSTLKKYVSNRWKQRPPLDKFLSQQWLEYSYGWMPLVLTAYEIAGQMGNILKPGPSTQLFTRSSMREEQNQRLEVHLMGGAEHRIQVLELRQYKCKYFIVLMMNPASKAKMISTYTSMNPASIAWELVPYSFVVDWFYDIGSYLRGCESALMYNSLFANGWLSEVRSNKTQFLGLPRSTSRISGSLQATGSYESFAFTRSVLTQIPVPQKPVVGGALDLSWRQLTSALALLRQAL